MTTADPMFNAYRRNYTPAELQEKLEEARVKAAAPLLRLVVSEGEFPAIAITVDKASIRLTPWLTSREAFIMLDALCLLQRIWAGEDEHRVAVAARADRPRRGLGKRGKAVTP